MRVTRYMRQCGCHDARCFDSARGASVYAAIALSTARDAARDVDVQLRRTASRGVRVPEEALLLIARRSPAMRNSAPSAVRRRALMSLALFICSSLLHGHCHRLHARLPSLRRHRFLA